MDQNFKGIMFCNAGFSSSLMTTKLNELGKSYGITFNEGGFGTAGSVDDISKKYDFVLLAPHLKPMYEDLSFDFEEKNIPFIQVESDEYNANGQGVYKLFDRIKKVLNI